MKLATKLYAGASVVCFLAAFMLICLFEYNHYLIDKEILGWQIRAKDANDPKQMAQYIRNMQVGMEKFGMTEGYSVLVWETPENDMGLIYTTVGNHLKQSMVISMMRDTTPEYQTGLYNLRRGIEGLDIQAHQFWTIHGGLWYLIPSILLCLVFLAIMFKSTIFKLNWS